MRRRVTVAVLVVASLSSCGSGRARDADRGPQSAPPPVVSLTTVSAGSTPSGRCARHDRTVQSGAEVEPHVAVDPADPEHLIAAWQQDRRTTGGAVGVATAESTDGGATWTTRRLPGGAPCGARGLTGASDPWTAIGPDGTAYVASLPFAALRGKAPNRSGVTVNRRMTRGGTTPEAWAAPVFLAPARSFDDKPSVTADPGRRGVAYVVWHRGNRTLLSRTADAGVTWARPRRIAFPPAVGHVILPLPGGRLLLTALAFGRHPAFVAAGSDDGGRTWGRYVVIGTPTRSRRARTEPRRSVRAGGFASVAVLPGGTVVAVWARALRRGAGVVRSVSRDGGRTWSAGRVVLRRTGHVFTPTLAARSDGTLGLSWIDTSRDRAGDSAFTADAAFASSRDAGRSWRERRVAGPFDLRRGPRAGRAAFLGDYSGLVPTRDGFGILVAVAPPVARRGRSDVVFIRVRVRVGVGR